VSARLTAAAVLAETQRRLDAQDRRIDALFRAMHAATQAAGLAPDKGSDDAYEATAAIQARRAQMHLVTTEAGQ
jgi:hypothetical protein